MIYDPVDKPKHYVEQSARVEPIEVLRWAPFDLGSALKYMIRAGHKDDELQDLRKAEWYLECASETSQMNIAPYYKFFMRYSGILQDFNGIPIFPICETRFIFDSLLDDVRTRISKLNSKNKGATK